ncbi:dUTP diphosphatase [Virgibacillus sp. C22-A2]|uniref:dUTP diphosphatase n=1 Tax=Virgibacillus tibetensis TaxID=3042313 RepID=A0ABU6KAC6_9BACI|nr:dUTP diphosphatase [Virgibacillus sp. C22-A2]
MNLTKLFEIQKTLDDRIMKEHGLEGQDLLNKKILALQVELGELANEWRGFKFWSKDQRPRVEDWIECSTCNGTGDLNYEKVQEDAEGSGNHEYIDCEECDCAGTVGVRNPLLEEYVDCLHFILSIGLDLEFGNYPMIGSSPETKTVSDMFLVTFETINMFYRAYFSGNEDLTEIKYTIVFDTFITLGEMLGFTTEQIEQAYLDKNKINHERQNNDY